MYCFDLRDGLSDMTHHLVVGKATEDRTYPTIYERSRNVEKNCRRPLSATPRWEFVVHTNSTQVIHTNST